MLAADCGVVSPVAEAPLVGEIAPPISSAASASRTGRIVFIDQGVENVGELVAGLAEGDELVLLQPDQDGLAQITQVLSRRSNVASVHIIAHGAAGQLQLGDRVVDRDVVLQRQDELRGWSKSFAVGADILIYGCETGANENGHRLIQQIARITRADVAASTDKTGADRLGGDWDLERHVGTIEAGLVFDSRTRENYDAVMPITIRASGSTGEEQMFLQIDGVTVATFDNVATTLQDYTYDSTDDFSTSQIQVFFSNDLFDPDAGIDRNLRVDNITVDGVTLETEAPDVFSTGTWKPEDGTTPGFREDEVLHTNGYFQYPVIDDGGGSGTGSQIEMFVRGDEGTEQFNLFVQGQVVGSYTASTELQSFSYEHSESVDADDVRIEFVNSRWEPENGLDENLVVDFITIDGTVFQTEDPAVFSTGTWKPADGVTAGFRESETLHTSGYFQFAGQSTDPGNGSVIVMQVSGDEGTERFNLVLNGQTVGTFDVTTEYQPISYTHDENVVADDVRIEFINDQWDPAQGIDANLNVDFIVIDGTIYQTEHPSVFSTGSWLPADGSVPGFRQSESLNINGYFQYASDLGDPSPGRFAFSAPTSTVDESSPSIQIRVERLGGTDGVVSVDYATIDNDTTELEDYVPVVGRLTFGEGESSMLITVPIIQDPFSEGDETFNIQLSNPIGGATIDTAEATVTIVDDDTVDPAGFFRFERPMYMLMEGQSSVTVKVLRDGGSNGEVTVDYRTDDDGALAGEDYTASSGTLTFADGEIEKSIVIPILEDDLTEDDERFWVYLENPTGGASTVVSGAQLIIMDNEPRPGSGDGLYAQYFGNTNFTDLQQVQVDQAIDFNWGSGGPGAAGTDTFSIRWAGQVEAMFSEDYTFTTTADDGVRLWVDGQLIIDDWTTHPAAERSGTITLQAGQRYDIQMEYFEQGGLASVKLEWSSNSLPREIIPESQLYSGGDFQRGGSSYRLTPTKMTWQEAQAFAQRLGGNLVTINDAAEESWLQATFGSSEEFWIGLNDIDSEGNLVWASGESVDYTNFAPGQPDNSGNQDAVSMNFGAADQWGDASVTSSRIGIIEVTGDSLPAQNAIFGDWSEVIDFPNIAVAAAQLPDGEIVTWSSWDRFDFGGNNPRTYTSVFNTQTREVEEFLITNTQHDMFCPGTVMLPDGRILVNGGGSTVTSTSIYDFETDTWTRVENMNMRRWYNTSVTLGDGRVMTWGGNAINGHAGDAEIWEDGVGWTTVPGMNINIYSGTGDQTSWHPQLFQAPNGKVLVAGPGPRMYWADTSSTGDVLEYAGDRGTDGYSQHGSYVMYDVGKILKFGGADREANNGVVTDKAYIIDITGDTPIVTETGSMNFKRKFVNGLVLPDGRVMAIGGNTSGKKFSDDGSVFAGEIWDPATGQWSVMDAMNIPRNYHSVALLQADGTVFAAGGGLTGGGSADHPDAQVFRPDYLFNRDGSLADRPDITTTDRAQYGDTISLQVTDGQAIERFNLIRMSTVTHSVNTDQRLVPVSFSDLGGGDYALDMPVSGNIAPPGYYMLYALNSDGTPSEAAVIQLGDSA